MVSDAIVGVRHHATRLTPHASLLPRVASIVVRVVLVARNSFVVTILVTLLVPLVPEVGAVVPPLVDPLAAALGYSNISSVTQATWAGRVWIGVAGSHWLPRTHLVAVRTRDVASMMVGHMGLLRVREERLAQWAYRRA